MVLKEYDIDSLARELDQVLIYAGQGLDEPPPEASRATKYVMPLRAFATSVVTALGGEALSGLRIEFAPQDSARTYRVVATTPTALVDGEITIRDSADGSDGIEPSVIRCRLSEVSSIAVAHDVLCVRERQGVLVPKDSSVTLEFPGGLELLLEDHSDPQRAPRAMSGIDLLTVRALVASVARA